MKAINIIRQRATRLIYLPIVLLIFALLFLSCSRKDLLQYRNTGSIEITATWPEDTDNSGKLSDKTNPPELTKLTDAPIGVEYISVTVSGSDFPDMEWQFDASRNSGNLDEIPSGTGRSIYVVAEDEYHAELYNYLEEDISIDPAQTRYISVNFTMSRPDAPTNVTTAWADGSSDIEITWDDNSINENYFIIERRLTSEGSFTVIDSVQADSTEYYDIDYNIGDEFYYRVHAKNTGGISNYSNEAFFSTSATLQEPSNVDAFWYSNSQIGVSWQDNSNNESYFIIEKNDPSSGWSVIDSVTADNTLYIDQYYNMGDLYAYRVNAKNGYGQSAYSNEDNFDTNNLPPAQPYGLYSFYNGSSMKVVWRKPTGADGYIIYRDTPPSSNFDSIAFVQTDTVYWDNNTYDNDWYTYRIKAANQYGYSDPSQADSAFADHNGPLYFRNVFEVYGSCGRMFLYNGLLFVSQTNNLLILDVSTPGIARYINSITIGGQSIRDIAVANDWVFTASGSAGIYAIDISDPQNPGTPNNFTLTGTCQSIALWDTVAFVGSGGIGIHSVNISNPNTISYISSYDPSTDLTDIKLEERAGDTLYAIAAGGNNGLVIIKVDDPGSMQFVNSYLPVAGSYSTALSLRNFKAFIAAGDDGLQIVDYASFFSLYSVGDMNTSDAKGVDIKNSRVVLADGTSGLKLINVSGTPSQEDSFPTPDQCKAVILNYINDYLYVSVDNHGIFIFEVDIP
ncbi:MAG: hypothetical protein GY855_02710 [candidate division Zixibacteria bacterium]|nr:hypothetical protein [candidate division Zixibacteria bacterium]